VPSLPVDALEQQTTATSFWEFPVRREIGGAMLDANTDKTLKLCKAGRDDYLTD